MKKLTRAEINGRGNSGHSNFDGRWGFYLGVMFRQTEQESLRAKKISRRISKTEGRERKK